MDLRSASCCASRALSRSACLACKPRGVQRARVRPGGKGGRPGPLEPLAPGGRHGSFQARAPQRRTATQSAAHARAAARCMGGRPYSVASHLLDLALLLLHRRRPLHALLPHLLVARLLRRAVQRAVAAILHLPRLAGRVWPDGCRAARAEGCTTCRARHGSSSSVAERQRPGSTPGHAATYASPTCHIQPSSGLPHVLIPPIPLPSAPPQLTQVEPNVACAQDVEGGGAAAGLLAGHDRSVSQATDGAASAHALHLVHPCTADQTMEHIRQRRSVAARTPGIIARLGAGPAHTSM